MKTWGGSALKEIYVYDKAKYHFGGDYPQELPIEQAYVHTGMYLGWIIDNELFSTWFKEESLDDIEEFKKREITGTQIYKKWDGVLTGDMLSDEGNKFSLYYFEFEKGEFPTDYDKTLASDLPSLYYVQDTWDNYYLLKEVIDQRYIEWKRKKNVEIIVD